jgi:putative ABC transport system permease protein
MLTLKRAFKNIWRRRFRTLLVSLVLALCVAVFVSTIAGVNASKAATTAMMNQYEAASQATIEETQNLMSAIEITAGMGRGMGMRPPGGSGDNSTTDNYINQSVIDAISAMDGVTGMVGSLTYTVGANTTSSSGGGNFMMRFSYDYRIRGVTTGSSLDGGFDAGLPTSITEGRNLQEGDDNAVVIGEDLKDYFSAGVGDTVTIEGTGFQVVGVYSSNTSSLGETSGGDFPGGGGMQMEDKDVYMSLTTVQSLLNLQGDFSQLTVYASDSSAVDDLVATIQSAYPDLMVFSYKDMQSRFGDRIIQQQQSIISTTDENLSSIESLGLSITVVSVIIGVLLIFGLMFYTVRERTKEIGTLKALGFSNTNVMRQFMIEGLYVGIIGGAVGLAIAAIASSALGSWLLNASETLGTSVAVSLTVGTMLLGLGIAAIAGALGSLYPAWRASRVSPMEALRND